MSDGLLLNEWQKIDSAPKDGTLVLCFCPNEVSGLKIVTLLFHQGYLHWADATGDGWNLYEPTHWMPMPPPPKDSP